MKHHKFLLRVLTSITPETLFKDGGPPLFSHYSEFPTEACLQHNARMMVSSLSPSCVHKALLKGV